jgi:hypothetical protein
MSKKPNGGEDLSNWTMEELNNVINEFIKEQNKKNSQILKDAEEFQNKKQMVDKMNFDVHQPENPSQIEIKQPNDIPEEITCGIFPKTILNDKVIKVEIKNPKIIETNTFSPNYVTYQIETVIDSLNLKYNVQRRYSDFLWLREMLIKFYPHNYIPPMPGKKFGGRRFEPDFINKRMFFLQKFINIIINNEEFKSSDFLLEFLTLQETLMFDLKKKEYNNIPIQNNLLGIRTIDGKMKMNFNDLNGFFNNIKECLKLQSLLLERLNDNLKEYNKANEQVVNSLENIKKDFELLHYLNDKIKMKQNITKTFEELRFFFSDMKKIAFNKGKIIKKKLKYFFKYYKMESDS